MIVTGPPASAKTTLARAIADGVALPLVAKDPLKELLFDSLGTGDVEWSRRLGRAVYALLFHVLELELRAGRSCVLEANFDHAAAGEQLRRLQARLRFRAFQVVCTAEPKVLRARYLARAPDRHPGHLDEARVDEVMQAVAAGRWLALDVPGERLEVDTTDAASLDVDAVVERARAWLAT